MNKKDYFTIYDFEDVYLKFFDEDWDGEPIDSDTPKEPKESLELKEPKDSKGPREKVIIELSDGRGERELPIQLVHFLWKRWANLNCSTIH